MTRFILIYRFIATGKHIGKVVIKVRDEEPAKVTKPATKLVSAIPKTYMHPDKSYVLVGKSFGCRICEMRLRRVYTNFNCFHIGV